MSSQRPSDSSSTTPSLVSTVQVETPDRLMDTASLQRKLNLQLLVHRYLNQIQFGCINKFCTTPTCLSCNKRVKSAPFRAPTQLTARALAFFLASQDDPYTTLCPYQSKAPSQEPAGELKAGSVVPQAKKDNKSFAQNLQDTAAVRQFLCANFQSPRQTFESLQAQGLPAGSGTPILQTPSVKDKAGLNLPNSTQRVPLDAHDIANADASPSLQHIEKSSTATKRASDCLAQKEFPLVQNSSTAGKGAASVRWEPREQEHSPLGSAMKGGKDPNMNRTNGTGPGDEKPTVAVRTRTRDLSPRTKRYQSGSICVVPYLSSDIIARLASDDAQQANLILQRSLYYALSDPSVLVKSFREPKCSQLAESPLAYLDPRRVIESFQLIKEHRLLICDSLWEALEALFARPSELRVQRSHKTRHARRCSSLSSISPVHFAEETQTKPEFLDDAHAAHIIVICIYALTSLPTWHSDETWLAIRECRPDGFVPTWRDTSETAAIWRLFDEYEYEPAIRLADRLVRAIAVRRCFSEMQHIISYSGTDTDTSSIPRFSLMDLLLKHLTAVESPAVGSDPLFLKKIEDVTRKNATEESKATFKRERAQSEWTVSSSFLDWLQTILVKQWDGNLKVNRWNGVGAALEIMEDLYRRKTALGLHADMFLMRYLDDMHDAQWPGDFMTPPRNPNNRHLLEFHFLFPIQTLVEFFRVLNHSVMYKQVQIARAPVELQRRLEHGLFYLGPQEGLPQCLLIDVRRDHALEDALHALWGLPQHQYLAPLKVRFRNEEGLDQGGVSTEFFQVILQDAFSPVHGMFMFTDQMRTWFRPGSRHPAWRYEMIGVLLSLAVYNGITVPVDFALALYAALMDIPINDLDMIDDAWSCRLQRKLLEMDEEEVAQWGCSYVFSFEVFGLPVEVDMTAFDREELWPADYEGLVAESVTDSGGVWPDGVPLPSYNSAAWTRPRRKPRPEQSARPGARSGATNASALADVEFEDVTVQNREQYIQDYLFWLTDKSVRTQLRAFKKGFYKCLEPKAIGIFGRPERLQAVVEGGSEIDTERLKKGARYGDGYTESHPSIVNFWSIVSGYKPDKRRKLLEFITGRSRLPAGSDHVFTIVKQGSEEHLPSSLTCALQFNLPAYETKEKMAQKLGLALEQPNEFNVR